MSELKVAMVGAGGISGAHLRAWKRTPRAQVVAVCDTDSARARSVASNWGIARTYDDLSKLLSQEKVDIVDVVTPVASHCKLVTMALERGCHVICEKPLSVTVAEAEQMVGAARQSHRLLDVIHSSTYAMPFRRLQNLVAKGAIGEVCGVHVDVLVTADDAWVTNAEHWVHRDRGGKLGEAMPHVIHMIMAFVDGLEWTAIETRKRSSYPWIHTDELLCSFSGPGGMGSARLSIVSKRNSSSVTVYGTDGALRLDRLLGITTNLESWDFSMGKMATIYTWSRGLAGQAGQLLGNGLAVVSGRWASPHDAQIAIFADRVASRRQMEESHYQAILRVMRLLDQALEVLQRGPGKVCF